MNRLPARLRTPLAVVLSTVSAVVAVAALLVVYVDRAVFDSDNFVDRSVVVLDDAAGRELVAGAVTDSVIERNPDLIPYRPAIAFAADEIVGSSSFEAIFRQAAREAHRVFFDESGGVVLRLGDAGQLLIAVVGASSPEVAAVLPPELQAGLITVSERQFATDTLDAAESVGLLAVLLPLVAALLAVAALAVSANRRRAVVVLGLALSLACAIGLVGLGILRRSVIAAAPEPDVAAVLWSAFVSDLSVVLLVGLGMGVVAAAAAGSLILRREPVALVRALWTRAATRPAGTGARAGWAAAVGLAGLFVALNPRAAVDLVAIAGGALLLFIALTELMKLVDGTGGEGAIAEARRTLSVALRVAIGVAAVAVIGVAGLLLVSGEDTADAAQQIDACNGSIELCDRPITAVSIAATHNSMSAARDGFQLAMHDGGIVAQLDGGIRGLLIDTWYGIPRGRLVLTDLPASGVSEQEQAQVYGQAAVDAAARLRQGAGTGGERRTYLCHGFCELGATPLADELGRIRTWLEENPSEVLVVIVQDAISPADTERAFAESGLLDLVHHHSPERRFPTLREMIASGERVVVMAENDTGDELDWYLQAYEVTEETPFRALSPDEFTCRPARGGTGKPFFLLNHWIERPQPRASDARVVNAREFLLQRARTCEQARGRPPGLIAVNFWDVGDLLDVVDELNGVAARPENANP